MADRPVEEMTASELQEEWLSLECGISQWDPELHTKENLQLAMQRQLEVEKQRDLVLSHMESVRRFLRESVFAAFARNGPWQIVSRDSCWAIVDSLGNDIGYTDKRPMFYEGKPCGSVTSRGFTEAELLGRAKMFAAGPTLLSSLLLLLTPVVVDEDGNLDSPLRSGDYIKASEVIRELVGAALFDGKGFDKHGFRLCCCGCNRPLADANHPDWPADWKPEGPDHVPDGFSNGLHGPPGPRL